MPRYFFDVIDTGDSTRDEEGVEFADLEEARQEALRTLGEIAKDELPDGDRREFTIHIREDNGPPVLTPSLSLHVKTRSPDSN
jgi:hypothetical protein